MKYRTRTPRRTATQCPKPESAASSPRTYAKSVVVTKKNLIPPHPRLDHEGSRAPAAVEGLRSRDSINRTGCIGRGRGTPVGFDLDARRSAAECRAVGDLGLPR